MKVIKQFYVHNDKTYYVGDEYKGKRFKEFEKYVEIKKRKSKK